MFFRDRTMTAQRVVLIGHPDDQYNVKRRSGVVEKFRHYGLHACWTRASGKNTVVKIMVITLQM